ncbi:hypothetical protein [Serratia phage vB_SmaS_Opt-169]|nr:hypothetical protein [Serratia phage vB_SmaS_Opt-169]UGO51981.1 hypothetical protein PHOOPHIGHTERS_47 [Serratia phage vB_SmaS_PhooPhighters]
MKIKFNLSPWAIVFLVSGVFWSAIAAAIIFKMVQS